MKRKSRPSNATKRRKRIAFWVLMVLVVAGAFLSGRAYGWYEADRFMEAVARALQQ